MKTIVLHRKDGTTFEGTAYECARKLMKDGVLLEMKTGQPYGRWAAEDFCRANNIDHWFIKDEIRR